MKIGELSAQTGTPVETIRFYEKARLLPLPDRTAANYRIYTARHAARLAFIRHCRSLDMALDEIRVLLALKDAPDQSCEAVNQVLDEHIAHVSLRIRQLKALQKQLQDLRGQCSQAHDAGHCGILGELSKSGATPSTAPVTPHDHVRGAHGHPHGHGQKPGPGSRRVSGSGRVG